MQEGPGGNQSPRSFWQIALSPPTGKEWQGFHKTWTFFPFSFLQSWKNAWKINLDYTGIFLQTFTINNNYYKTSLISFTGREVKAFDIIFILLRSSPMFCLVCTVRFNGLQKKHQLSLSPNLYFQFLNHVFLFFTRISASNDYLANSFNTSLHQILGKE